MKEINQVDRNGYITQGLDLTLRARTRKNEIICFSVTPDGTTATCKGSPVVLVEQLREINKIVDLISVLKNVQIDLDGNKVVVIPFQKKSRTLLRGSCAGAGCAADATACPTNVCGGYVCGGYAGACAADACGGAACGAKTSAGGGNRSRADSGKTSSTDGGKTSEA